MPSDDIAISARNLTKTYRLFGHPGDRVKQFFSLGLKRYHREFTALKDISFEVKKGETFGIIGRNGSGKSTLLQLICGILKPSSGSVTVNGRVSALLELGAGFNPEFTGRENVYFHGAVVGLTEAEMDARFDAIAGFADIGEFIDQPVRIYSSGMFVRLAFAAAIHVSPDILVIDEALAVGDQAFQGKCLEYMERLRRGGRTTIIYVSHNVRQVERLCNRALLIDHGYVEMLGEANVVCNAYFRYVDQQPHMQTTGTHSAHGTSGTGVSSIVVERVTVGASSKAVGMHAPLVINIHLKLTAIMDCLEVIIGIHTADMMYIALSSSAQTVVLPPLNQGRHHVTAVLDDNVLRPGNYWIGVGIYDCYGRVLWREDHVQSFVVSFDGADMTRLPTSGFVDLPFQWRAASDARADSTTLPNG